METAAAKKMKPNPGTKTRKGPKAAPKACGKCDDLAKRIDGLVGQMEILTKDRDRYARALEPSRPSTAELKKLAHASLAHHLMKLRNAKIPAASAKTLTADELQTVETELGILVDSIMWFRKMVPERPAVLMGDKRA